MKNILCKEIKQYKKSKRVDFLNQNWVKVGNNIMLRQKYDLFKFKIR